MKLVVLTGFLLATLAPLATRAQSEAAVPPVTAPPLQDQGALSPIPMLPPPVAKQYELRLIDTELFRLRAERPRIFWPIALVATGGAIAVAHAAIALYSASTWGREGYRWDDQGNRSKVEWRDKTDRDQARGSGVGVAVGLTIAAVGIILLKPRVEKRRELRAQARDLTERRSQLIRELGLNLSMNASPHHGAVATSFHF